VVASRAIVIARFWAIRTAAVIGPAVPRHSSTLDLAATR
jgi:hypothetical protein